MIRLAFIIFVGIIGTGTMLQAQPKGELFTMAFRFEDGIYLSFERLQNNQPDLSWEEVDTRLASNPKTFVTQVEYIKRNDEQPLAMQDVAFIVLSGIPYVRLEKGEYPSDATAFAGLKVRGKICYFSYEKEVSENVEIKAYNPLTKKPFRKGNVPRTKLVEVQKMLHFETGEIVDFNYVNLLLWIEDDPQLKESVFELKPGEIDEKLYKCLLIYDDRNVVYIGK